MAVDNLVITFALFIRSPPPKATSLRATASSQSTGPLRSLGSAVFLSFGFEAVAVVLGMQSYGHFYSHPARRIVGDYSENPIQNQSIQKWTL